MPLRFNNTGDFAKDAGDTRQRRVRNRASHFLDPCHVDLISATPPSWIPSAEQSPKVCMAELNLNGDQNICWNIVASWRDLPSLKEGTVRSVRASKAEGEHSHRGRGARRTNSIQMCFYRRLLMEEG